MKTLLLAITASLALAGGTAWAQETKDHHDHSQAPAASEEKAGDTAEHKEMCACCKKEGGGMAGMQDKMKDMMSRMKDTAKEHK